MFFSLETKFLYSSGLDHCICVWDTTTGTLLQKYNVGSPVYSITYHKQKLILVAGTSQGFRLLEMKTLPETYNGASLYLAPIDPPCRKGGIRISQHTARKDAIWKLYRMAKVANEDALKALGNDTRDDTLLHRKGGATSFLGLTGASPEVQQKTRLAIAFEASYPLTELDAAERRRRQLKRTYRGVRRNAKTPTPHSAEGTRAMTPPHPALPQSEKSAPTGLDSSDSESDNAKAKTQAARRRSAGLSRRGRVPTAANLESSLRSPTRMSATSRQVKTPPPGRSGRASALSTRGPSLLQPAALRSASRRGRSEVSSPDTSTSPPARSPSPVSGRMHRSLSPSRPSTRWRPYSRLSTPAEVPRCWADFRGPVEHVSCQGEKVFCTVNRNELFVFDMDRDEPLWHQHACHAGDISVLSFESADSPVVTGAYDQTIKIWSSTLTNRPVPIRLPRTPTGACYIGPTNAVWVATGSPNLEVFDTKANSKLTEFIETPQPPTEDAAHLFQHLLYIAETNHLVASTAARGLVVWRHTPKASIAVLRACASPIEALVSNEGDEKLSGLLLFAGAANGSIYRFEPQRLNEYVHHVEDWTGHAEAVTALTYSSRYHCLVSASTDQTIRIWRAGLRAFNMEEKEGKEEQEGQGTAPSEAPRPSTEVRFGSLRSPVSHRFLDQPSSQRGGTPRSELARFGYRPGYSLLAPVISTPPDTPMSLSSRSTTPRSAALSDMRIPIGDSSVPSTPDRPGTPKANPEMHLTMHDQRMQESIATPTTRAVRELAQQAPAVARDPLDTENLTDRLRLATSPLTPTLVSSPSQPKLGGFSSRSPQKQLTSDPFPLPPDEARSTTASTTTSTTHTPTQTPYTTTATTTTTTGGPGPKLLRPHTPPVRGRSPREEKTFLTEVEAPGEEKGKEKETEEKKKKEEVQRRPELPFGRRFSRGISPFMTEEDRLTAQLAQAQQMLRGTFSGHADVKIENFAANCNLLRVVDNRLIASAGTDLFLLHPVEEKYEKGKTVPIRVLREAKPAHPEPILGMDADDSENILATCCAHGDVRLWDVGLSCIQHFNVNQASATAGVLDSERQYAPCTHIKWIARHRMWITCKDDSVLHLWRLDSGRTQELVKELPLDPDWGHLTCLAIQEHTGYALIATADRIFRVWDLAGERVLQTFPGHQDVIRSIIYLRVRDQYVTGSADQTLRVWAARQHNTAVPEWGEEPTTHAPEVRSKKKNLERVYSVLAEINRSS